MKEAKTRPKSSFGQWVVGFSVFMAIFHTYLWFRLVDSPALGASYERWATIGLMLLGASVPGGAVASRLLSGALGRRLAYVGFAWLGFAVLIFFGLLTGELVRLVVYAVHWARGLAVTDEYRLLVARAIAGTSAAAALLGGLYGLFVVARPTPLREVTVSLDRLPRPLDGFRIVQISDVHAGNTVGPEHVENIVARTNTLDADLIAITGDLVDGPVDVLRAHLQPLNQLRAKHGVYFVTGNHEYYYGDVDALLSYLTDLGIRVLRNERVAIGSDDASFDLAGIDDHKADRFGGGHGADLERATAGRDPTRELVLLAHQPKQVEQAQAAGVGLQLAGHTHAGQIFPWSLFVRLDQPVVAGLARFGDTQIYVSSGTGYWGPPMRVAAPGELTLITLESARVDTSPASTDG